MTHLRTSSVILGLALAASVASGCHSRKAGPENTGTSGTESSDSDTESASSQARDTHKIPSESDLATLRENFRKVHFDFDNAALTGAARSALDANAQLLMKYSQVQSYWRLDMMALWAIKRERKADMEEVQLLVYWINTWPTLVGCG